MRFFVAQLRSPDGAGMHDPWLWQCEAFKHPRIPHPFNIALRRPARQPPRPEPAHLIMQQTQALVVARNAKIGIVPCERPAQSLVLHAYRPMPHPLASLMIALSERARLTFAPLPRHRLALPRLPHTWVKLKKLKVLGNVASSGSHADRRDLKATSRVDKQTSCRLGKAQGPGNHATERRLAPGPDC
jgi:hypothetical protein